MVMKIAMAGAMLALGSSAFALTAETALEGVELPAGYVLLEHVRTASQGSYVDTKFVPDGTVSWELVMRWDGAKTVSQHIMGSRIGFQNNAVGFSVQCEGANNGFTWHYGNEVFYSTEHPSHSGSPNFNVIAFTSARNCEIDGEQKKSMNEKTVATTLPVYLFTCNNNGSPHGQGATAAVRRFRIWKGDELKLDYVPAKCVANGAVGFYNLTAEGSEEPFVLPSAGALEAGAAVSPEPGPDVDPTEETTLAYSAADDRGTVVATADGGAVESGAVLEAGAAVELTATPKDGYQFAYWSGDVPEGVSKTTNPIAFSFPEQAVSLSAYFLPTNRVVPAGWTEPNNGVLLLTFDDSAVDTWISQLDLFDAYGAHASFAVIGDPLAYGDAGAKLLTLKARGHTIGLHTQDHVNTDGYEADPANYFNRQIKPQLDKFAEMGHVCTYIAYPNNKHNDLIDNYILANSPIRHFRAGEVATETGSPYYHAAATGKNLAANDAVFTPVANLAEMSVLNGMGCAVQQYGTSVEEIKAGLVRIASRNEVMVLFSHDIQSSPSSVGMTPAMLEEILSKAKELGVRVVGADELPYLSRASEEEPEEPEEQDVPIVAADGFTVYEGLYERVESLSIDGSEKTFFDTGYLCNPETRFRVRVAFTSLPESTDRHSQWGVYFVPFKYSCAFGVRYQEDEWKLSALYGDNPGSPHYGKSWDAAPHEFDLAPGSQRIDGVEIGTRTITQAFPSTGNRVPTLYLFRFNNDYNNTYGVASRFYFAEISELGNVLHRYYPARRLSDGCPGIYDEIAKKFYSVDGASVSSYDYAYNASRIVTRSEVRRKRQSGEAETLELQFAPAESNTCSLLYVCYGERKGADTFDSWAKHAFVGAVVGSTNAVSIAWPAGAKYARWFWKAPDAGGRLPANEKYTSEVAYIESQGNGLGGYVNTGVCPNGETSYEVVAQWLSTESQFLLGSRDSGSFKYSFHASSYEGTCFAGGYGTENVGRQYRIYPDASRFQTWRFDAPMKTQTLENRVINVFTSTWGTNGEDSPYPAYLFTVNNNGAVHGSRACARVKSFKLWKGGDLACDYVPVRVGDVPAFYDCVSKDVIYATGGTFTMGNDVEPFSPGECRAITQVYKDVSLGLVLIVK